LKADCPVLGVCLGHQGIADVFGTPVTRASRPVHGERFAVNHTDSGIFAGLPQGFHVVRYHSLAVVPPIRHPLRATAWTSDGVVMGLEHYTRPVYGVQFHPESILSEHGSNIVSSFKRITEQHRDSTFSHISPGTYKALKPNSRPAPTKTDDNLDKQYLHVSKVKLKNGFTFETVFRSLYTESDTSFWLDTTRDPVNMNSKERVVSFAGAVENEGSGKIIEYWEDELVIRDSSGKVLETTSSKPSILLYIYIFILIFFLNFLVDRIFLAKSIFDFIDSFTETKSKTSIVCDESCSKNDLPFTP